MNTPSLCILALAATTGACNVLAQSKVDLFGIVDLAVQRVSTQGQSSATRIASGSNQTSRIGLRGQEDLGGGLSAAFWLEGGFAADSGLGVATNTNNQASGGGAASGLTFDRRSTVSIQGAWGEARVGKDYVPTYWNVSRADPFFANGVGSVRALIGAGSVNAVTFVRASNSMGYHLPGNLGGWYGQAMVAAGENNSGAANSSDGKYTGLRVGHDAGRWNVAASTGQTKFATGDYQLSNIYAGYDFGVVRVSLLWNQGQIKSTTRQRQRDHLVGIVVPVGLHELKASYVRSRVTTSATGAGADLTALGYVHNLSKRTGVYLHYARVSNKGTGTFGNAAVAPTAGGATTGYEAGVRHFF